MGAWITNAMPELPAMEPYDWRSESDTVLIQTTGGELRTARWVTYGDEDMEPCWVLSGSDGWTLEPRDVMAWQSIERFTG